MGSKGIHEVSLVIFVIVTILSRGAKAAESDCIISIVSMSPCLNYIIGNSPNDLPSPCRSSFANVLQTLPRCISTLLNDGGADHLSRRNFNSTIPLSFPMVCNMLTPLLSRCHAANEPGISTADSEDASTTPSVEGSNKTGATATPSNGSVTKIHLQLIIGFLMFLVSYVSTFSTF